MEEDLALLESLEAKMGRIEEMLKEEIEFHKYREQFVRDASRTISYYDLRVSGLRATYDEKIKKIDENIAIINENTEKISKCESVAEIQDLKFPVLK
eukprot:gnl/Chilomastix_caulleri/1945.p1 GENE.gnl/Chilomastix_caulleri/1945~~gnl/Chilomastix_caulleri/1945.p1  ORF type:complete len:97 (+),score=12.15 gnl/Chilomastix_caulleri/1945:41-331(+)